MLRSLESEEEGRDGRGVGVCRAQVVVVIWRGGAVAEGLDCKRRRVDRL